MAKLGVSPHLISIVADLSRELPDQLRYWRLLDAILSTLSCDAAALLAFEPSADQTDNTLIPLAIDGLDDKLLEQRFSIEQHPRFAHCLQSPEPVYFPAESQLPNPFQSFLKSGDRRTGPRDSLGIALHVAGKPWGLLCLNTRQTDTLNKIDRQELRSFINFIESAIAVLQRGKKLRTALEYQQRLHQALLATSNNETLLGDSPALARVKEEIAIIAASELTILLQGEDGVGKSLVARDIHQASTRSKHPFIRVDCASLDDESAYAELFGATASDNKTKKTGLFQLADQGTLFINEVATLPADVQSQLEHLLKTGSIQPLNSATTIPIKVRLIAATRCNLQQLVSRGEFRPELYRLLMLYPMPVPPLRERTEDIPLLSKHFLELQRRRLALPSLLIDTDARKLLQHYPWPGNVRELDQVLRRATLKAMAEQKGAKDLVIKVSQLSINLVELPRAAQAELASLPEQIDLKETLDNFQRQLITDRLAMRQGNLAATARDLSLNRSNFYRLLQRLGIK
ncbi:MAG: nitric oxide reductase transcription regulator [Gammaproteobacteria bacterium]|nr:MAG: nitric oxide reductase transcription regulator [Gammaproteobacteria bacterium]